MNDIAVGDTVSWTDYDQRTSTGVVEELSDGIAKVRVGPKLRVEIGVVKLTKLATTPQEPS